MELTEITARARGQGPAVAHPRPGVSEKGRNDMGASRWKSAAERDLGIQFDRRITSDPILRTLFEVMFEQENRLRVLENRPAVTRAQALASLRSTFTGQ